MTILLSMKVPLTGKEIVGLRQAKKNSNLNKGISWIV